MIRAMIGVYCFTFTNSSGQYFTMPFTITSEIEWRMEDKIWPDPCAMPLDISPVYRLLKSDAYKALDCLKEFPLSMMSFFWVVRAP